MIIPRIVLCVVVTTYYFGTPYNNIPEKVMKLYTKTTAIIAAAALSGCAMNASAPVQSTVGALMSADADRAVGRADAKLSLASQWKEGDKRTADGAKMVRQGETRLKSAAKDTSKHQKLTDKAQAEQEKQHARIAEGHRLIEQGRRMRAQAEQDYTFEAPPAVD